MVFSGQSELKEKPFQDIIVAMKNNSVELFKNSFSRKVINSESDISNWDNNFKEAKKKFNKKFGVLDTQDFSYQYDSAESKLIILFKGKEEVRMRITEENGVWKLDEH